MTLSLLTIEVRSERDVLFVRQRARQIAELVGFEPQDHTRISTAVSEIARNAVQHAGGGTVEFQLTAGRIQSLQVLIKDFGPGILDLDGLLQTKARIATGPGRTMRGVRKLMDLFNVETSPRTGTIVTLGKERPPRLPQIQQKQLPHITKELLRRVSEDPLVEMQLQNQELLRALEELRVQQEERLVHLEQIEMLNSRLRRSIQATHHRVKNHLQIISAMVEIQTFGAEDTVPTAALTRIGQHTRALAVIHDLLTEETKVDAETEVISAESTMSKLMALLQATAGGRRITYHADDFMLPARDCASLALLVSEIVSNALKHGKREIEVSLAAGKDMATLEVCDDGPGFPPEFNWVTAANTGLSLVDSAGRHDLRGVVHYENRPAGGARVIVNFPIRHSGT